MLHVLPRCKWLELMMDFICLTLLFVPGSECSTKNPSKQPDFASFLDNTLESTNKWLHAIWNEPDPGGM